MILLTDKEVHALFLQLQNEPATPEEVQTFAQFVGKVINHELEQRQMVAQYERVKADPYQWHSREDV